jgi:serine/threonine protein kinase
MGKQLAVATNQSLRRSLEQSSNLRVIEQATGATFNSRYALGYVVAPSSNPHCEIRFGRRKSDNTEVVIKIRYKPHCFKSQSEELEWRHSIDFMLNLPGSPTLAKIHEVLEDQSAFYVISEKVEGLDLQKLLASQKGLTVQASRAIIQKLLEAAGHLHDNSVVHRDLKLENIMVDTGAQDICSDDWKPAAVKIIDFDCVGEWTPSSPALRDVVGTDGYLAQEAYIGQYSPQSDMFALGVIAYRFLTGKFPFHDSLFTGKHGDMRCGSPKMRQIRCSMGQTEVDWNCDIFKLDVSSKDLVQKMMSFVEKRRPSAAQALQHKWFSSKISQQARQYKGVTIAASKPQKADSSPQCGRPPKPPAIIKQDTAELGGQSPKVKSLRFALPPPEQSFPSPQRRRLQSRERDLGSPSQAPSSKEFGLRNLPGFKEIGAKDFTPKEFGPKEFGPKEFGPKEVGLKMQFSPRESNPKMFAPKVLGPKASVGACAADVRAALERPFASGGKGSWKPSCLA